MDRPRAVIAGVFSRLMRTRFAHRFLPPLIPPMQMRLYSWTGGRFQLSALLMPSLVLISTGAKSGQRRETPLACWPQQDGTWLIAGSNWGQDHHPGWTANLRRNPDAEIVLARRHIKVSATMLAGTEREAAWPILEAQFPGYRDYERQAGREVRIFRLVDTSTR
jgi:deazaflavin-dependent oxidoreductase (nitroreductase family)